MAKHEWDITFCSNRKCKNINCIRHLESENAKTYPPYKLMYITDFTDMCKEKDNNG